MNEILQLKMMLAFFGILIIFFMCSVIYIDEKLRMIKKFIDEKGLRYEYINWNEINKKW